MSDYVKQMVIFSQLMKKARELEQDYQIKSTKEAFEAYEAAAEAAEIQWEQVEASEALPQAKA